MKRTLIAAAAVAALFSATAWAQMGPGMMGGAGPGGGYGPGYGMGPGMMGGYGPGMMGPGMMGGYGPGYGMGPGMMGGGPGYGMGPGMMGGYGPRGYAALNLSDEQRAKISAVQQESSRKQWDLMGKMQEQGFGMHQLFELGKSDDAAARNAYQAMADAHKQMFEASLDARKRIDAVLTNEQREQLKRNWRGN